jgi:hypothetical protein
MSYRISGLDPAAFRHLFGLPDAELARFGAIRYTADREVGFPDRIELRDATPGQTLLLVNHVHQPAATPYRASHAIFVREGAEAARVFVDEVPEVLRRRTISLRAFDARGMIVGAELADGDAIAGAIEQLLADSAVAYIHAHYAKPGCYAALIERTLARCAAS